MSMSPEVKEKVDRRLAHLRGVLEDCEGEEPELMALYLSMREMMPGICEGIAEQMEDDGWLDAYRDRILSDEQNKAMDQFIWADEEP